MNDSLTWRLWTEMNNSMLPQSSQTRQHSWKCFELFGASEIDHFHTIATIDFRFQTSNFKASNFKLQARLFAGSKYLYNHDRQSAYHRLTIGKPNISLVFFWCVIASHLCAKTLDLKWCSSHTPCDLLHAHQPTFLVGCWLIKGKCLLLSLQISAAVPFLSKRNDRTRLFQHTVRIKLTWKTKNLT